MKFLPIGLGIDDIFVESWFWFSYHDIWVEEGVWNNNAFSDYGNQGKI